MPLGVSTCAAGVGADGPGRKISGVWPARQNVIIAASQVDAPRRSW